jgi:hypothetical protein
MSLTTTTRGSIILLCHSQGVHMYTMHCRSPPRLNTPAANRLLDLGLNVAL